MGDFVGAEVLLFVMHLGVRQACLPGVEHRKGVVLIYTGRISQFCGCGLVEVVAVLVIVPPVQGLEPLSGFFDISVHVTA